MRVFSRLSVVTLDGLLTTLVLVWTELTLLSRNARKYCLQSTSCLTGLLDIFIYFIFDIILSVLVEFH